MEYRNNQIRSAIFHRKPSNLLTPYVSDSECLALGATGDLAAYYELNFNCSFQRLEVQRNV